MAPRYEVVGTLARGGMAEILLARARGPEGFARAVVLKRILPHLAKNPRFRTMFLDEARVMAGIHHSNVVNVHELHEEGDELWLVMDYLEGESLASVIRAAVGDSRALPAGLMAFVVAEACAGLHAAHEAKGPDGSPLGLVHRDVSPQNLFLTYDGHVRLLDFGIAHAAGRGTETEAGQIKGKFAYMSPEQCRGQVLDRRSDVFALGIVLFEATTQRRLFMRDSDMQTMRAVCKEPIADPTEEVDGYPAALAAVVRRALLRDRAQRFESAQAMEQALRSALAEQETHPRAALAALMRALFAERIEDKAEMLRTLRMGEGTPAVAEAETRLEVTVPTAAPALAVGSSDDTASGSEAPRSLLGVAAALVAVVALAAGGTLVAGDAVAVAETATLPEWITVHVETTPPGVEVRLRGEVVGTTPLSIPLPPSDEPMVLVAARDGYETVEQEVVPNVSQRFALRLTPATSASASSTAPPVRAPVKTAPKPATTSKPAASSKYYQL